MKSVLLKGKSDYIYCCKIDMKQGFLVIQIRMRDMKRIKMGQQLYWNQVKFEILSKWKSRLMK